MPFLHPASGNLGEEANWRELEQYLNGLMPKVTSLTPGQQGIPLPVPDGFPVIYVADATNGILWPLRYNAGSASSYKWETTGGSPLHAAVDTDETTTSNTYTDLATVGPSITVPLAGEYMISGGGDFYASAGGGAPIGAVKFGASGAVDNDRLLIQRVGNNVGNVEGGIGGREIKRTVSSAGMVLKLQYRSPNSVTCNFAFRVLSVRPVRVG